jgi:hypothetical protein
MLNAENSGQAKKIFAKYLPLVFQSIEKVSYANDPESKADSGVHFKISPDHQNSLNRDSLELLAKILDRIAFWLSKT